MKTETLSVLPASGITGISGNLPSESPFFDKGLA